MRRLAWLALACALGACETYAESVGCGMGLVLDEHDRCVAPRAPDGGIASCAALCDAVPTFSEARRGCLSTQLAMLGGLPASCAELTTSEACLACTSELGANDAACGGAAATCP